MPDTAPVAAAPRARSMLRGNLLLLLPLMLVGQLSAAALAWTLVQRPRMDDAAALFASQIALADRLLAALPPAQRPRQLAAMAGVATRDMPAEVLAARTPHGFVAREFARRLRECLPAGVELRWGHAGPHAVWVRLRDSDDRWLPLSAAGASDRSGLLAMLALLLATGVFPAFGAWLIHRRVDAPLRRLAQAADEVAHGNHPPAVAESGPAELVTVTRAFNGMVATLADGQAAREQMLAGISHDIRTPLTKLRMVVAAPDSVDDPAACADRFIEEIDAVVGQFVDYARGADTEAARPGRLDALVEQLAADFAGLGHRFELELGALPPLAYRPISMQRLLLNLMRNAVNHGRCELRVRTGLADGFAFVAVEDGGPGIPPEAIAQMRQPFRRGADAAGGGTGLGLAIADRIARQHGGSLELAPRRPRGLAAILRLPVPPSDDGAAPAPQSTP